MPDREQFEEVCGRITELQVGQGQIRCGLKPEAGGEVRYFWARGDAAGEIVWRQLDLLRDALLEELRVCLLCERATGGRIQGVRIYAPA